MNKEKFKDRYHQSIQLEITDNKIIFPNGYYFRNSSISNSRKIFASQINEVNINTLPLSMVIDHAEVIFADDTCIEDLKDFAIQNNIPLSDRFDIWGAINDEFLDTECTKEEKAKTLVLLEQNGVPPDEVVAIRKQIKYTMLAFTLATWEWVYIGQFDVLRQHVRTKKSYWWTMEIALRNMVKK